MEFGREEERCIEFGLYMVEKRCTVRKVAAAKGTSKTTVHKYLTVFLPIWDSDLYQEVRAILDKNKAEGHIRGGQVTKRKFGGKMKK